MSANASPPSSDDRTRSSLDVAARLAALARAFARSAGEAAELHAEMLQIVRGECAGSGPGSRSEPAPAEVARLALGICRTGARKRRLERTVAEKLAATDLPVSARSDPAAGDEFPAALEDALSRIEPSQAEALRLCVLAGLPVADAAALLDLPEESVRRAVFQARRHLADMLTSGGAVRP